MSGTIFFVSVSTNSNLIVEAPSCRHLLFFVGIFCPVWITSRSSSSLLSRGGRRSISSRSDFWFALTGFASPGSPPVPSSSASSSSSSASSLAPSLVPPIPLPSRLFSFWISAAALLLVVGPFFRFFSLASIPELLEAE